MISRMTLTNTMASPAPSTPRASTANPNESAYANASWPTVISTRPVSSIRREP